MKSLIKRKFPVLYRWARRRRYFPHAVLIACILVVLPVGVISGARVSQMIATNRALAATRALAPEHSVFETMSESERAHHAAALSNLVTGDPRKLYHLIAQDFLVMFHEPDLKRKDGPVSIWQYRTEACVLDVFFNHADGPVSHYEMRPRKVATFNLGEEPEASVSESDCLQSIYRRKSA